MGFASRYDAGRKSRTGGVKRTSRTQIGTKRGREWVHSFLSTCAGCGRRDVVASGDEQPTRRSAEESNESRKEIRSLVAMAMASDVVDDH